MALTQFIPYKPKMGDKFTMHKVFSSMSFGECEVVSISPSGQWFKVSGNSNSFSAKTFRSRGATMTSGYYLVPVR
jgi:hypothetical protein